MWKFLLAMWLDQDSNMMPMLFFDIYIIAIMIIKLVTVLSWCIGGSV